MARSQIKRNSFNAGEISALALGRTDLSDKYNNACEEMQNFIPLIVGGATRRPGMRYICQAMGPSRLVPFVFSLTQAFVLEFGNQLLRFYTNGGQIQSAPSPISDWQPITTYTLNQQIFPRLNNPGRFLYAAHGNTHNPAGPWESGNNEPVFDQIPGTLTPDGFHPSIPDVEWSNTGATVPPDSGPYQVATPYNTSVDDLWDLKFAQQGDIVYIVHPNHPPMKLARVSDTSWILVAPRSEERR